MALEIFGVHHVRGSTMTVGEPTTRVLPKIDQKKIFFRLKPDSDRVLSPDSEYRSQSGRFGR